MRFRTRSLPACSGKCMSSHPTQLEAIASLTSSIKPCGGGLVNRERADRTVHPRRLLEHHRLVLLHLAPADRDPKLWALVLHPFHLTQRPVQLLIGVLADRTRVEQNEVGGVRIRRARIAVH